MEQPVSPSIAEVKFGNKVSYFHVDNPMDYVQREIVAGQFYELHQLLRHKTMIPYCPGAVVVDVGANIGNHSIFYAQHTRAERIICFEANPAAATLLRSTVQTNRLSGRIDVSMLEIAVSNQTGNASIGPSPVNNLGATRVLAISSTPPCQGSNSVPSDLLDNLIGDSHPSFIKIDVEGHEINVLEGAQRAIDCFRPSIAIEVNRVNEARFWKWIEMNRYHCIDYFYDYDGAKNYCIIPKA